MLPHWFKNKIGFLLKDELQVHIQLDYIELLRIRHPLRGKAQLVQRQVIDLPHVLSMNESLSVNENSDSGEISKRNKLDPWAALTTALGNGFQQPICQKTKPVFIVANHLVRYVLMPWHAQISNNAEKKAYLAHCFKTAFGDATQAWSLAIGTVRFEKASIASAMPAPLLRAIDALQTLPQMPKIKVNAVYPALALALKQAFLQLDTMHDSSMHDSRMHDSKMCDFWFVMVESSRICVCLIENGDWKLLKNLAREPDVSAQVNAVIQREMVDSSRLTAESYPVVLHWQSCWQTATQSGQTLLESQQLSIAGRRLIAIQPDWLPETGESAGRWALA